MVQLFGRITKDATLTELKDEKKVVNFSIALNDSYKSKGREWVKQVTYVNCAYWINPANAAYLTKGKLIEVNGRMSVRAFINMKGDAVGTLNFHVDNFKLYGGGSPGDGNNIAKEPLAKKPRSMKTDEITEPINDLPF
jgi:single-strand DNA-binding protein